MVRVEIVRGPAMLPEHQLVPGMEIQCRPGEVLHGIEEVVRVVVPAGMRVTVRDEGDGESEAAAPA